MNNADIRLAFAGCANETLELQWEDPFSQVESEDVKNESC